MSQAKVIRPTRFAAPLVLYLVSAVGGLWNAHGQSDAWFRFGVIVASLALYGFLTCFPERLAIGGWRELAPLDVFLGLLPTALSTYFVLTNDWSHWIGKLPWLDPAMRWFSTWAFSSRYALNPNIAGGLIAVFLPLQLAAMKRNSGWRPLRWLGVLAMSLSGLGLLLSASRGAWLAVGLVAGGWGWWRVSRELAERWAARFSRARLAFWLLGIAMAGLLGVALGLSPWGSRLGAFIEADRAIIWRNSFDLATDYPFTGIGFGRFELAYSSYVLLLHVGHTFHAHNLFLDIWLQQGGLGLLSFGWLLGLAAMPQPTSSHWRGAALAAVGIMVLHGLVDDAFYALGGGAGVLLFVPFALLARSELPLARPAATASPARKGYRGLMLAGLFAGLILGLALIPGIQAAFLANLGALAQNQSELSIYHWPEWPIQDELRRSPQLDLGRARQYYQAALALDPGNVTANRRLGQIELSLGQYEAACYHLQEAYRVAPWQRATRQLRGECYAITGETQRAAELWQTIEVTEGQLELRQWWYEHLGDQQRARWLEQARILSQQ